MMHQLSKKLTYYLAGPMSGIAKFNFPMFDAAAHALREQGFTIVNPAELDSDIVRYAAMRSPHGQHDVNGAIGGESWGSILARDVGIVADKCDGVIFLPRWSQSRGARLEAFTGVLCGHLFGEYRPAARQVWRISPATVKTTLARELLKNER